MGQQQTGGAGTNNGNLGTHDLSPVNDFYVLSWYERCRTSRMDETGKVLYYFYIAMFGISLLVGTINDPQ